MKKITLNLINEALTRDEMRALVGGGSGIGSWCGDNYRCNPGLTCIYTQNQYTGIWDHRCL
ncbi:hypothetical protein ACJD0Z_16835 [Flavobacteriaceae bacterium M23B6Z8]